MHRRLQEIMFPLFFPYMGKNKGKRSFLQQQTCEKHRRIKGFQ